jgi:CubicO group peptidase (beta-lactamase class C family)
MPMKTVLYTSILLALLSCDKETKNKKFETIDKFMRGQTDFFKFNGNVLVAEKGKVIYQRSFGLADYATERPLNDSTVFELASVSKQFTAMGILLLEKQGKLTLNDTLRKYYPELPYSNITLHHMLTHTSGLPDYMELMADKWDHSKIAFNADIIAILAKEKPQVRFKPNSKWEYSNTAYVLLASIIEKVSDMSFKEFMQKNIYEQLDMRHSRVYNMRRSGETVDNYAYGYVWSDSLNRYVLPDSLRNLTFVYYLDGIQGDGITNSTITDLLKWDRALFNKTLLGEEPTKRMLSPHVLSDTTTTTYYGYGVFVGKNEFGNYVTHSGGWPGYTTNIARYVEDDITIIVLSNNNSASPAIQATIANIIFGKEIEYPYEHRSITVDPSVLNLWTGTYIVKNREFDISRSNDSLFQVFKSGYRRHLLPESDSKLFYSDPKLDVQFEIIESQESVTKYYQILYGVKEEMKRIK